MTYKDKERAREYARNYSKKYRQEHKEEMLARTRVLYRQARLDALSYYSVRGIIRCARCGNADIDVLSLDHINNDGAVHRRLTGTGTILYYWLKKHNYPAGFQVLCHNCNWKKRIERGRECQKV